MRRFALVLSVAIAHTLLAQPSPAYRITHTYMLGGDGSWDYVVPDPPQHRIFIGRQNRVMVVDENNGKLLGEVTVRLGLTSRARLAAENLFLGKQLALYQERHTKPRRLCLGGCAWAGRLLRTTPTPSDNGRFC
jgi:hypothetical protein